MRSKGKTKKYPPNFLTHFNRAAKYQNLGTSSFATVRIIDTKNANFVSCMRRSDAPLFRFTMEQQDFDIHNSAVERDGDYERALRPGRFEAFAGQDKIVENLQVFVTAARMRGEPLDHLLLHGPPGLGKTTLSAIIANELGVGFKVTSGPVLDKPGDLAGILTSLEENDVLFIDEIHRLSHTVEEYLYSAMEDYRIDIMIDKGPGARSVQLSLNPFTLVGATTRRCVRVSESTATWNITTTRCWSASSCVRQGSWG